MQRQLLKKWIKSLEKQYLFIRMILLFSDQNWSRDVFSFFFSFDLFFPFPNKSCDMPTTGQR